MNELPDKMSDLLELAVNDCEEVQKRPDCVFDMSRWLRVFNDKCHVCMAGAVMLQTLKKEVKYCTPAYFELSTNVKLRSIDYMREGDFGDAANIMPDTQVVDVRRICVLSPQLRDAMGPVRIHEGEQGGRAEWDGYRRVVKLLRENGL